LAKSDGLETFEIDLLQNIDSSIGQEILSEVKTHHMSLCAGFKDEH
jgi:hypothetical protein